MNSGNYKHIREEYSLHQLNENDVNPNPVIQFNNWFSKVIELNITMPNTMTLSTVDVKGKPSARIVLLKEVDRKGFVFFTNYGSKKAKDMSVNSQVALLFYWKELERQVKIEGTVKKVSRIESEEYFHSRPRESQIAAWVSNQSEIIPDRKYLDEKFEQLQKKFGDGEIPLPVYWGGYRLLPNYFEFWQGRENRLHDRICYRKKSDKWEIFRLAP